MSAEAYYIQLAPGRSSSGGRNTGGEVEKAQAESDPEKREKLMPDYPEPTE